MTANLSTCPNGCGVRHENGVPTKTNCVKYTDATNSPGSTNGAAAAVPTRNRRSLVDQHWDDRIDSLNDAGRLDGEQIGEDSYGPYIEADDGRGHHEVGYTEYLDWHAEHKGIDAEFLESGDDPDAEDWLNDRGEAAVKARIAELLAKNGMDKDIADSLDISQEMGGDDPNFTMTLAVPSDADMTVRQMFDRIANPFFGTMQNGTDPGTFGHPYLFSDLKTPDSYFLSLHDDSPELDAMREKRYADYEDGNDHILRGVYNTVPELIALKRSGRLIGGEDEGTAADWTSDESASIKQAWKHGEHRELIEEHFPGEADEARRETERGD